MRPKMFSRKLHVRHQFGIARGDRDRALGQHHVHVRQQRAEERPLAIELLQERHALLRMLRDPALDRGAEAVPARQHQPALRPAEHPGNGAQILDLAGLLARRRAAADVAASTISVMTVEPQK